MLKLYTSYWAQVKNFPKNLIGLNTTVFPPHWRPLGRDNRGIWVIDCPPLKPGRECVGLCNGKCNPKHPDDCEFLKVYRNQLDNIDVGDFLNHLDRLAYKIKKDEDLSDVDFAAVVFEAPQNKCSERVALQSWGAFCGLDIKEWHK